MPESRKILIVASIEKHILRFHIPSLKWLHEHGYEVHVACNGKLETPYSSHVHQIDFVRTPFALGHIKALWQMMGLLKNQQFELIHCHTAAASVITRIAANKYRRRGVTKVLYTAHGFHFFKGGPWHHWFLYYPLERFFSRYLTCQVTINSEDYDLAKKRFFCEEVRRISGMGVDGCRFKIRSLEERLFFRNQLQIPANAKVLVYVAEFIYRKNHTFIINNARALKNLIPDLIIFLPGRGVLLKKMIALAKKNRVEDFVLFPGFRNDVDQIVGCADLGISSSRQEGLGMNVIESLMSGLPVIATDDRGHREIIKTGKNGFLYPHEDSEAFCNLIYQVLLDETLYHSLSIAARPSVLRFELKIAIEELGNIYKDYLEI